MGIIQQLQSIGFDDKEAGIYLAILNLGSASISDIAKRSGIKRPTVYHYIDELVKKQLVYKTAQGKRVLYTPQNPQRIISFLEENRKRTEKILPELLSLYQSSPKQPKIRFYEGKEGLKTIYEEIFNTSQIIYSAFSPSSFYKVFTDKDNARFFEILKRNGGRIYDLLEKSEESERFAGKDYRKGMGRIKFLPDDFNLSTDILVARDKIAMISFQNLTGVLIENREIAETQNGFLKFMWKRL
jgi:sugar-specific transcriptional regulator TrmB